MKKIVSIALALLMVLSLLPVSVLAGETNAIVVNGVGIYTEINEGVPGYHGENHDGIRTVTVDSQNPHDCIQVPFHQAGEPLRLFLVTEKELNTTEFGGNPDTVPGIIKANNVTLTGKEKLDGKNVYWLDLTPAGEQGFGFWVKKADGAELLDFWFEKRDDGGQGGEEFSFKEVKIFTHYHEGDDSQFDYDNSRLEIGQLEAVMAFCQPGQEKTLYLLTDRVLTIAAENDNDWHSMATLTSLDGNYLHRRQAIQGYKLTLTAPEGGEGDVRVQWDNDDICFHFVVENNGGQQGNKIQKTYTTRSGASTITVTMTEEQAKVVSLSDEIDENNTITLTVKDVDAELWRTLLSVEDGFTVYFSFDSCEPPQTAKPQAASIAGNNWQIEEGWEELQRRGDTAFYDYNTVSLRNNGIFFAESYTSGGRTLIVPTEDVLTSAWIWRYGDGQGGYQDVKDGFYFRVVLADEVAAAIALEAVQYPFVEKDRVEYGEFSYTNLDQVLAFVTATDSTLSYENGTLTYAYQGDKSRYEDVDAEVLAAATKDKMAGNGNIQLEKDGTLLAPYALFRVEAPEGYFAKSWHSTSYDQMTFDDCDSMVLRYNWSGLGIKQTYTLTWCNEVGEEYVEQLTISTPGERALKWMDYVGQRMPAERVVVPTLPANCGAEMSYSDGLFWTQYDNTKELDVDPILAAQVQIKAPENAVSYQFSAPGDGNDDPTYNANNGWLVDRTKDWLMNETVYPVPDTHLLTHPVDALNEQQIGDIRYYYSADYSTICVFVNWIFADGSNQVEYMQLDTSPYVCTVTTEAVHDDASVTGPVENPLVVVDSDIKLTTRKYPQNEEGRYFFELEITDGQGNVIEEFTDETLYKIILPYAFMGEEWNYVTVTAAGMKAPIINHYDKKYHQLVGNEGAIQGVFTERGIEFTVKSFSPFMLTWSENTTNNGHHSSAANATILAPDTGDAGIALYGVMSVMSLMGMGYLGKRKKH